MALKAEPNDAERWRAEVSAAKRDRGWSLASCHTFPPEVLSWGSKLGSSFVTNHQTFVDPDAGAWLKIDFLPGVELLPLAQPVTDGSIHKARLAAGTIIPVHTHPADEFVLVLSGTVETGGRRCEAGTFWTTPADTRQGPHVAVTDVELLTVRLGAMGPFGE
jgi:hypothetical protein